MLTHSINAYQDYQVFLFWQQVVHEFYPFWQLQIILAKMSHMFVSHMQFSWQIVYLLEIFIRTFLQNRWTSVWEHTNKPDAQWNVD